MQSQLPSEPKPPKPPRPSEHALPLLLLPLALETRFLNLNTDAPRLLVRVQPDQAHIYSFNPELSPTEKRWAAHFYDMLSRSHNDEEVRKEIWRAIVDRFGAQRAAWIVRSKHPLFNLSPTGPSALLLPDRLLLRMQLNNEQFMPAVLGEAIPRHLAVFDPEVAPDDKKAQTIGTGWTRDFKVAVSVGMAFDVPLSTAQVDKLRDPNLPGLDLTVIGSRDEEASHEAQQVFFGHRYSVGLDLLPQGSSTNNIPQAHTSVGNKSEAVEQTYGASPASQKQVGAGTISNADADRSVLWHMLGLPADSDTAFEDVQHFDLSDQASAAAMNTALWPATLGYFLDHIFAVDSRVEGNIFKSVRSIDGAGPEHTDSSAMAESVKRLQRLRDSMRHAERHFTKLVRARGSLPPIRIGKQPYGILPVYPHVEISEAASEVLQTLGVNKPIELLASLRDLWTSVARPASPSRPDEQLQGMLLSAVSPAFAKRRMIGRLLYGWSSGMAKSEAEFANTRPGPISPNDPLEQGGLLAADKRIDQMGFDPDHLVERDYMVRMIAEKSDSPEELSDAHPLLKEENYIDWLITAKSRDVLTNAFIQPAIHTRIPLLYRLLRHAVLEARVTVVKDRTLAELATGAIKSSEANEVLEALYQLDPEYVPDSGATANSPLPILGGQLLRKLGDSRVAQICADDVNYTRFIRCMKVLTGLPTRSLSLLLRETLDLCSVRLDAWITSIATQRLFDERQSTPCGLQVGAYGWAWGLRPRSADEQVSHGYVHAPSAEHAITAGVLHGGYRVQKELGQKYSIQLNSRRARMALEIFEGLRSGLGLSALLGYRVERMLQEQQSAELIWELRIVAGLADDVIQRTDLPKPDAPTLGRVVDGLRLLDLWHQKRGLSPYIFAPADTVNTYIPPASSPKPTPTSSTAATPSSKSTPNHTSPVASSTDIATLSPGELFSHATVVRVLTELDDIYDALNDLALAEGIHQIVKGKPDTAAGALNAISRGDLPPEDFEVTRMPRRSLEQEHRLVVAFDDLALAKSSQTGWTVNRTAQVLTDAEPTITAWLAHVLPDPHSIDVAVDILDVEGSQPTQFDRVTFTLSELACAHNFGPLELVLAANAKDVQSSVLGLLATYHARNTYTFATEPPSKIEWRLVADFQQKHQWRVHMRQFAEQARAIAQVLRTTTPLNPKALNAGSAVEDGAFDVMEFRTRASRAVAELNSGKASFERAQNSLGQLVRAARAALTKPDPDINSVQKRYERRISDAVASVQRCAVRLIPFMGVDNAAAILTALNSVDGFEANLREAEKFLDSTTAILKTLTAAQAKDNQLQTRMLQLDQAATSGRLFTEAQRNENSSQLLKLAGDRLRTLFGSVVTFVPFLNRSDPRIKTAINCLFTDAETRRKTSNPDVVTIKPWLSCVGRVRPGVSNLMRMLLYAQVSRRTQHAGWLIAQQPYPRQNSDEVRERWAAEKFERGKVPIGTKSVVIHCPLPINHRRTRLAGLVIDNWLEHIPAESENTALSFHFDAPTTRPPQSMLLCVPKKEQTTWSPDALLPYLDETRNLILLRQVTPSALAARNSYNRMLSGVVIPLSVNLDNTGAELDETKSDSISTRFF